MVHGPPVDPRTGHWQAAALTGRAARAPRSGLHAARSAKGPTEQAGHNTGPTSPGAPSLRVRVSAATGSDAGVRAKSAMSASTVPLGLGQATRSPLAIVGRAPLVLIFQKETAVAQHTSGHVDGVHTGGAGTAKRTPRRESLRLCLSTWYARSTSASWRSQSSRLPARPLPSQLPHSPRRCAAQPMAKRTLRAFCWAAASVLGASTSLPLPCAPHPDAARSVAFGALANSANRCTFAWRARGRADTV